jgi:hypothetical protein
VWALKSSLKHTHHSFVIFSFLSETRVSSIIDKNGEVSFEDVTDQFGFDPTAATMYCDSLGNNWMFQVHSNGIVLSHYGMSCISQIIYIKRKWARI